ncbi:futalosine hydrolase [Desulforhopalus vacuolatus]|uniref:futalosine hydrolase n=1 Tax=Desulforhopalus vacuolatus TaxID=40414 RepID=UPI001962E201|nr:futalosine hydrolase [Desulforhopalus vacuolatus]
MILLVAATEREMAPLRALPGFRALQRDCCGRIKLLVTGVGPVAAAIRLTRWLADRDVAPGALSVVQFGVGGGWAEEGATLLDLCIAEREVFGDLGVAVGEKMEYFDEGMIACQQYLPDVALRQQLQRSVAGAKSGTFVTVQAVSGTSARGNFLHRRWLGLCENMEGAAAAAVCEEFALPFAEIRSISNYVEDRNPSRWQLDAACETVTAALPAVVHSLLTLES